MKFTSYVDTTSTRPNPFPSMSLELQLIYLSRLLSVLSWTSRVLGSRGKSLLTINFKFHVDNLRIPSDQTPSSIGLYVLSLIFFLTFFMIYFFQILFSVNTGLLTRLVKLFTIQVLTRLIQKCTIFVCSLCALASLISVRTFFILTFECLDIDISQILVAGNTFIYIAFFFCLGRRKCS